LSVQDLDFHLNLLNQHREHTFALVQVGQFSTGGVGQFYSGANTSSCSRGSSLNMLRSPIAHSSRLARDEVTRLELAIKDWYRLME
jgi:hypothetical protein